MALSVEEKAQIVNEYKQAEGDTGSPEVQVALLSANINKLQDHFKVTQLCTLSSSICRSCLAFSYSLRRIRV